MLNPPSNSIDSCTPSALEAMKRARIERAQRTDECHDIDHVYVWGERMDVCMFCKRTETESDGQAGDY